MLAKKFTTIGARRRSRGYTLLEMSVVTATMVVMLGAVAAVFTVITRGTAEADMSLVAQSENQRGLMALMTDLQTTDPIGMDSYNQPYFTVVNHGTGTQNSIVFRRVEDFSINVAEDSVMSIWSTPIQYFVDGNSNLVRVQDGLTRIVVPRMSELRFEADSEGRITINLTTFAGQHERHMESTNEVQIIPRNLLKI